MRFKTLMLGVFLTALAVVSPAFGQDVCADIEANQALYKEYTEKYKGDVTRANMAEKERAVAAAKEYIEKYAACPDFKAQVDYLKSNSPKLAQKIADAKEVFAAQDRITRFEKAVQNKSKAIKANQANQEKETEEVFASGKDILKYQPDLVDLIIFLAGTGLDEVAANKNNTYNNETISYAKLAISKIEANAESKKYGAYQYEFKTRENALGWMNYTIGYVMFYGQKTGDAALPYFYKATQHESEVKDRYFMYDLIGDFYRIKAVALGNDIIKIIEDNQKLKPETNGETFETKMMYAKQKGYAERAIDAYARAYTIAKSAKTPPKPEYLSGLQTLLETFYKFRFLKASDPADNINTQVMDYVASVKNKPFPNPASEVQPVDPPTEEEKTPEAANSTPMTTPSKPPVAKTAATPTNGDKGKSEADKANNKPKKQ